MKHTYIILALACAPALHAQNLATEIKVDRTVVPEFVMAAKPYIAPQLLPVPDISARLTSAEYLQPGSVTRGIAALNAAPWRDSITATPYKGYASLGLFPKNYAATLGYRFMANADVQIGAWAQFLSQRYNIDTDAAAANKQSLGTDNITAAIDASVRTGSLGWLSAQAGYDYHKVQMEPSYSLNRIFADASWQGRNDIVAYGIHAGINTNSFKPSAGKDKANQADINLGGSVALAKGSDYPWLGIDIDARWLNASEETGGNQSHYSASPYFRFCRDGFSAKLGLLLSTATAADGDAHDTDTKKSKGMIAPNVRLDYAPERTPFAAYIGITGSQQLNPLFSYMLIDPYFSRFYAYDSSRTPLRVDAGINLGSFSGFSASINGAYANFRNWLMPRLSIISSFAPYDINAWKAEIKAKYAYRSYGEVALAYEVAGSNHDAFTWGEWHDSAKQHFSASVTATPITGLRVELAYKLRTGRKSAYLVPEQSPLAEEAYADLGKISDLSVEANYTVSEAWPIPVTFFARVNNLLNTKYNLISNLQGAPVNGLIGAAIQF